MSIGSEVDASAVQRAQFGALEEPDYSADDAWIRRRHPGGSLGDPAVFYVHPTTERTLERWFADPRDARTRADAEAVVAAHGHAFAGNMWAPAYRQATTRAFHQHSAGGDAAYDLAFGDVWRAFQVFLHEVPDGPIVIAGHSQGARHTVDLLAAIVAGRAPHSADLAQRLVAAYAIGAGLRPGTESVLAAFPLPTAPTQTGVLIGWNAALQGEADAALDRRPDLLSVNPITFLDWAVTDETASHLGGDVAPFDRIRVDVAQDRGLVLVEERTDVGLADFALPGGSLHAVEVQLFSRDVRADIRRRTRAWRASTHR